MEREKTKMEEREGWRSRYIVYIHWCYYQFLLFTLNGLFL